MSDPVVPAGPVGQLSGKGHLVRRGDLSSLVAIAALDAVVLTALTGARTAVIWFKICPVVLTCSAILLLVASFAS